MTTNDRRSLASGLRFSDGMLGFLGVATIGLGVTLILLGTGGPEAPPSDGGTAPLLVALLLLIVGMISFFRLYTVAVKGGGRVRAILHVAEVDLAMLERAESFVITPEGSENLPGGRHGVRFFVRNGAMRQFNTSQDEVEAILRYIARRVPDAVR